MSADPETKVKRLQRKLDARNQKIAGLQRRIAKLESNLALRSGDAVVVEWRQLEHAMQNVLCNVRMIPVLGMSKLGRILEVKATESDARVDPKAEAGQSA